jgi:site-specific DNA-methyltransferase (adenine-specific)
VGTLTKKIREEQSRDGYLPYINTVFVGSAENLEEIPDSVVDLTVTSPPYWNAIDYRSHATSPTENYRTRRTADTYEEYLDFLCRCFRAVFRVHRPGSFVTVIIGTILQNGAHIPLPHHLTRVMESIGFEFHQDILWHKCTAGVRRAGTFIQHPFPGYFHPNIMTEYILVFRKPGDPIYRNRSNAQKEHDQYAIDSLFTREVANNLWNVAPVPPGVVNHPCPFPEEIPDRLIRLYSYSGDLVLDPFCGSGTTLKAAKILGRNFVGVDIEPKYVEMAKARLKEKSGIRAQQLIIEFKKISAGEILPAKNPKQRRYRRIPKATTRAPTLFALEQKGG